LRIKGQPGDIVHHCTCCTWGNINWNWMHSMCGISTSD